MAGIFWWTLELPSASSLTYSSCFRAENLGSYLGWGEVSSVRLKLSLQLFKGTFLRAEVQKVKFPQGQPAVCEPGGQQAGPGRHWANPFHHHHNQWSRNFVHPVGDGHQSEPVFVNLFRSPGIDSQPGSLSQGFGSRFNQVSGSGSVFGIRI
jgi:hypothetical protein